MSALLTLLGQHGKHHATIELSDAEIGNVDASTVVAMFNNPVAAAGSDYKTGVTIEVNGSGATISTGTRQTNQAVVYYALSAPVVYGDAVTIAYSAATGHIVDQSSSPIALATFTARVVTNNMLAPGLGYSMDFSDVDNSTYVGVFL